MASTIFAVSSGAAPAAIAILRISGPDARAIAAMIAGDLPAPRIARVRTLHDQQGAVLDRAIVLVFPGPATATGDDIVEFHLHGGRAVVRAVERAIGVDSRARVAEPGEFTRRALENGRIDLTEAEGLADLLAAETEYQRRAAVQASNGMLRREIEALVRRVIDLAAHVEAMIDFSEEDDVATNEDLALQGLRREAAAIDADIREMLAVPTVDRLRDGLRIVLAGPPNSGKSSLINRLAGREIAIVSDIAGTTRDRLEAMVARGGIPFVLTDTAGLVERTDDAIEAIGVARAHDAIRTADIVLWLGDEVAGRDDAILLHARRDLPERDTAVPGRLAVSATTGEGVAALWQEIERRARCFIPRDGALALNVRQHKLLQEVSGALGDAAEQKELLLLAESLREALRLLDRITGLAGVEAMLDALFARFCIGK